MGKSSFPKLLLRGYITTGASVKLERDTWGGQFMTVFSTACPRKSQWAHPEREKEHIFMEFDRYIDACISNGFVMSVFGTYQRLCAITHTQEPLLRCLAHQQVRESRIHPWDKYVSLSRASLQSISQTWYFHAACVYNNSRCVSRAAAVLLQGSRLGGESKMMTPPPPSPHRTPLRCTDQLDSSEIWGRRGNVSTQKRKTDWQTNKGMNDFIWNVCLLEVRSTWKFWFCLFVRVQIRTIIHSHLQVCSNTTVNQQTK